MLKDIDLTKVIDETTDAIAVVAIAVMALNGIHSEVAVGGIVTIAIGKRLHRAAAG